MPQCAYFNQSRHEARILKVASEISIVDSMIFDDHPKLDLISIHSNSQDDWSCGSESIDNSNLENCADNSGLINETFSSFAFLISRVQ